MEVKSADDENCFCEMNMREETETSRHYTNKTVNATFIVILCVCVCRALCRVRLLEFRLLSQVTNGNVEQ